MAHWDITAVVLEGMNWAPILVDLTDTRTVMGTVGYKRSVSLHTAVR